MIHYLEMHQYSVYPQMHQAPTQQMSLAGNPPQNINSPKPSQSLKPGSYQFGSISIKPLQSRPTNILPPQTPNQPQTQPQTQPSNQPLSKTVHDSPVRVEKENLPLRATSVTKPIENVQKVI